MKECFKIYITKNVFFSRILLVSTIKISDNSKNAFAEIFLILFDRKFELTDKIFRIIRYNGENMWTINVINNLEEIIINAINETVYNIIECDIIQEKFLESDLYNIHIQNNYDFKEIDNNILVNLWLRNKTANVIDWMEKQTINKMLQDYLYQIKEIKAKISTD